MSKPTLAPPKAPESAAETKQEPTSVIAAEESATAQSETEVVAEETAEETAGDSASASENASMDPAGEAEQPVEAGSQKTLADFRAAFGVEQGSVYFADQVSFEDACVKTIGALQANLSEAKKTIAELQSEKAQIASELLGESEAMLTQRIKSSGSTGSDAVSAFAASAASRMSQSKT